MRTYTEEYVDGSYEKPVQQALAKHLKPFIIQSQRGGNDAPFLQLDVTSLVSLAGIRSHFERHQPRGRNDQRQRPGPEFFRQSEKQTRRVKSEVSRLVKRPIAMFVDQSDTASIREAMVAGVSAYVVDGLRKERVKHILDMCIQRFEIFSRMEEELREAKTALADRKVIERAKGILMAAKSLSEQDAYAMMRKAAMDQKRRLAEIARAIVMAEGMLK